MSASTGGDLDCGNGLLLLIRKHIDTLELCTPRAGELDVLAGLPDDRRIGVGLVNQKAPAIDAVEVVVARARRAVDLLGAERLLYNPDCGFATFADNPIVTAEVAEAQLAVLVAARDRLTA